MKSASKVVVLLMVCAFSSNLLFAQSLGTVSTREAYVKTSKVIGLDNPTSAPVTHPRLNKAAFADEGAGVLIGTMWNGLSSQSRATNQISYDPYSGLLVVIYRGGPNSSGELVLNTSLNKGANWSGPTSPINSAITNPAGQLAARHPSVILMNGTQSSDPATVDLAAVWSQLGGTQNTWFEVGYVAGKYGASYSGATISPGTPALFIPTRLAVAAQTGTMFSLIQTVDPSQGLLTGEYFLMKSVDKGKTWSLDLNTPVLAEPLQDGYEIYDTPMIDVSPDGQTVAISFLGILVNSGSFSFVDNKLGLMVSKDGGVTFSQPELIPITDMNIKNVEVDQSRAYFYPSQAMAVDANGDIHFMITISGDYFFIPPDWRDSTFVGEVAKNGSTWEFTAFSAVNNGRITRFFGAPGRQTSSTFWGEHEFAKSTDGMKLYAKWIDTDSLFCAAGNTIVAIDTTHDVYLSARDIRSRVDGNGWTNPINISNTPNFGEKYTKIASPVGADNRIHVIHTVFSPTEWRPGVEIPDADDISESYIYYIPNVTLDAPVATDEVGSLPSSYTLEQNYPNPFNPSTAIRFSLPVSGYASVKVFNSVGKEVAILANGFMTAGSHTVTFNASNLPSGQYFYRLESGSFSTTKAMTLIK